jgi:hypothetical protein
MTVPQMLETSAQNDENVETRVYLGGPTCEIAKSKSHHLRRRSGKMIRDGDKISNFISKNRHISNTPKPKYQPR